MFGPEANTKNNNNRRVTLPLLVQMCGSLTIQPSFPCSCCRSWPCRMSWVCQLIRWPCPGYQVSHQDAVLSNMALFQQQQQHPCHLVQRYKWRINLLHALLWKLEFDDKFHPLRTAFMRLIPPGVMCYGSKSLRPQAKGWQSLVVYDMDWRMLSAAVACIKFYGASNTLHLFSINVARNWCRISDQNGLQTAFAA